MTGEANRRLLTGLDESHLVSLPCGQRLQAEAAEAFAALQADASAVGYELAIASSYRSFSRQLTLWNGKASAQRPVHDDEGNSVLMEGLSPQQQLHAILRYSAIPGTSRHHWGTELDVFDAAALPESYEVQLTPQEVAAGGLFDPLHCWLDERMAAGRSHGFFRPYAEDRGGVAQERWHLSYTPLSLPLAAQFSTALLPQCWDCDEVTESLLLRPEIENDLEQLITRYVVVPDDGWAGNSGRKKS
ncbi:MAG: LAS superfamily LD-carboxypeptidase LdcB [Halioglobus sp.]|jgi:LAS superfamily LD-carboxypeptidase LdcB